MPLYIIISSPIKIFAMLCASLFSSPQMVSCVICVIILCSAISCVFLLNHSFDIIGSLFLLSGKHEQKLNHSSVLAVTKYFINSVAQMLNHSYSAFTFIFEKLNHSLTYMYLVFYEFSLNLLNHSLTYFMDFLDAIVNFYGEFSILPFSWVRYLILISLDRALPHMTNLVISTLVQYAVSAFIVARHIQSHQCTLSIGYLFLVSWIIVECLVFICTYIFIDFVDHFVPLCIYVIGRITLFISWACNKPFTYVASFTVESKTIKTNKKISLVHRFLGAFFVGASALTAMIGLRTGFLVTQEYNHPDFPARPRKIQTQNLIAAIYSSFQNLWLSLTRGKRIDPIRFIQRTADFDAVQAYAVVSGHINPDDDTLKTAILAALQSIFAVIDVFNIVIDDPDWSHLTIEDKCDRLNTVIDKFHSVYTLASYYPWAILHGSNVPETLVDTFHELRIKVEHLFPFPKFRTLHESSHYQTLMQVIVVIRREQALYDDHNHQDVLRKDRDLAVYWFEVHNQLEKLFDTTGCGYLDLEVAIGDLNVLGYIYTNLTQYFSQSTSLGFRAAGELVTFGAILYFFVTLPKRLYRYGRSFTPNSRKRNKFAEVKNALRDSAYCDDDEILAVKKTKPRIKKPPVETVLTCVPREGEKLFQTNSWRGKTLPAIFNTILLSDVDLVLNSLIRWVPGASLKTETARLKYVEIMRSVSAVRKDTSTEEGLNNIRDLIVKVYGEVDTIQFKTDREYREPYSQKLALTSSSASEFVPLVKYVKHPDINFGSFKDELFGEPDAVVAIGEELNHFGRLASECLSKNWLFPPQYIKSFCRRNKENGKTNVEILDLIKSHCWIWPHKVPFPPPIKRISWVLTYVPLEVFYYNVLNVTKFENILRSKMLDTRSQIIEFANTYLVYGDLSHSDRTSLFQAMSDEFANIKRTPEIQSMYIAGYTNEFINEFVRFKYRDKITSANKDIISRHTKSLKKTSDLERSAARDRKYIFTTESGYYTPRDFVQTVILFIIIWIGYVLSRLTSSVSKVAETVEPVMEEGKVGLAAIRPWAEFLSNPIKLLRDASFRYAIVDVKSVLSAAYYFYKGNKLEAANWISNVIISRPDLVCKWFSPLPPVGNLERKDLGTRYQQLIEIRKQNNLPYDDLIREAVREGFTVQAKGIFDFVSTFTNMFSDVGLSHLSDEDIRKANARYTYLANQNRETTSYIETVLNIGSFILKTVFGYDPLNIPYSNFVYTIAELHEFSTELAKNKMSGYSTSQLNEVLEKHELANKMSTDPLMSEIPSFWYQNFSQSRMVLNSFAASATSLLKGADYRAEPVCIFFTGRPGVGKSSTYRRFQVLTSESRGEEYDPNRLYVYTGDSEYWEGYNNQRYVLMDDLFTSQDTTKRERQASDVIRCVNVAPYSLNMAFASKGSTFFNSEYIMASSNLANDGIDRCAWNVGLTDREAFLRRLHIVVHRDLPREQDVDMMLWRVDKCAMFPNMIGKQINAIQLALLAEKIREVHVNYNLGANIRSREETKVLIENEKANFQINTRYSRFNPIRFFEIFLKVTNLPDLVKDKTFLAIVIGIFFALVAIFKFHSIASFFFPESPQPPQVTDVALLDTQSLERKIIRSKKNRWTRKRKHVKGFRVNSTVSNPIEYGNSRKCIVGFVAGGTISGTEHFESCVGFHVKSGYYCLPAHFYLKFLDASDAMLQVIFNGRMHKMKLPDKAFVVDGLDLVIIKLVLPTTPHEGYKYLPSDEDYPSIPPGYEVNLVGIDPDSTTEYIKTGAKNVFCEDTSYEHEGTTYILETPVSYDIDTEPGDSGAVIMVKKDSGQAEIIGMHVGSLRMTGLRIGMAISLWKEFFDDIIAEFEPQAANLLPHLVERFVDLPHMPPHDSKIKRSKFYDWCDEPCEKVPAHLKPFTNSDGVVINPLRLAQTKLHQIATPETPIPESVFDYLFRLYPRKQSRILSYNEALNGLPGDDRRTIVLSTSPGYPYSAKITKKGKTAFMTRLPNGDLQLLPEFEQIVDDLHKELLNGRQIEVLWADVLKDELRPIEKVRAGKTRLFSTCPLHYLILVRMYTIDFVTYVQQKSPTHPVSVGINPSSVAWRMLFDRLASKGQSIVAGDFSNYDGKLPKFVGAYVSKFINDWYNDGPVNARVRDLLFEHIFSATHVCYREVYRVVDGNPSGNPITSIYNSFCNIIMCYTILTEDFGLDPTEFELAVYGDDNVLAINRRGIRCQDLTPHFKSRFDLDYTHFSKHDSDAHDTLYSIRYLSRAFCLEGAYMRAPLPWSTIRDIPRWIAEKSGDHDICVSQVDSMFRELSHHPPAFFKEIKEQFMAYISAKHPFMVERLSRVILTYNTYIHEMYGNKAPGFLLTECRIREGFPTLKVIAVNLTEPMKTNSVIDTRNTDQTERAVNEPSETQQVQLGGYHDAAPVSGSSTNSEVYQEPHRNNNMEVFDLNGSLEREYLLSNIAWTTDQAGGTVLATFAFPSALFTQSYIADKIKDFEFFRAGIRVSIRIASSSFLYGKIIVYYVPNPGFMAYSTQYNNIFKATGLPHILVSASASETAVLDIPFINWNRSMFTTGETNGMGEVRIMVLNDLRDINGNVGSANIAVTANFLQAELWMPHMAVESKRITNSEMIQKSRAHLLSGVPETTAQPPAILKVPRPVRTFGNLFSKTLELGATAMEIGSVIGLDKPTSVDSLQMIVSKPSRGLVFGRGQSIAEKFAVDPANQITTAPCVGGISADEMDLAYIMGMPMMVARVVMVSGTPATAIMTCSAYDTNMTYVDFVRQNFQFWSGSMKFKAYITASVMHSVKVVFWLSKQSVETDWQDCYHRVVDIQGDTEVSFTVPYLDKQFATNLDDAPDSQWKVWVKILSWSQPVPSVSSPITLNVYKAASSDMRVGQHVERSFTLQSNPRADFAQPFEQFHHSFTGYEPVNLLYGEEIKTLRDIIHRTFPYISGQNIAFRDWDYTNQVGANLRYHLEMWGLIFAFRRGSIRVTSLGKTAATSVTPTFVTVGNGVGVDILPGLDVGFNNNPWCSVEIPWYKNRAFASTSVSGPNLDFYVNSPVPVNRFYFKSAGDDFSFHFLLPPPTGYLDSPAGTTYGFPALKQYYST